MTYVIGFIGILLIFFRHLLTGSVEYLLLDALIAFAFYTLGMFVQMDAFDKLQKQKKTTDAVEILNKRYCKCGAKKKGK